MLHLLMSLSSLSPLVLRRVALYFKCVCRVRWMCAYSPETTSSAIRSAAYFETAKVSHLRFASRLLAIRVLCMQGL